MKKNEVKAKQIISDGIVINQIPPKNDDAWWTLIFTALPERRIKLYCNLAVPSQLNDDELIKMSDRLLSLCTGGCYEQSNIDGATY